MEPWADVVEQLISDIGCARVDLMGLAFFKNIEPEKLACCVKCVSDLETALSEIVTLPWIPRDVSQLTASIACMNVNLRRVRDGIDAVDDVLMPHEHFRLRAAVMMQRLLEFQLQVLMTALAMVMKESQGHIWIN